MSIPEKYREALRQGFACYFEVSELPTDWNEWSQEDFDEQASAAASNIRYWVESAELRELIDFIKDERQKREGELAAQIGNWTRFIWTRTEEDWAALSQILGMIVAYLERDDAPDQ